MRIYIVLEAAFELGGAEIIGLRTAVKLAQRGHQVCVLGAYGPIGDTLQGIDNLEVRIAQPADPKPDTLVGKAATFWKSAQRILMQEALKGPAVVHFHSGSNGWSASAYGPMVRAGIPIVYTHHDYAWACPTQGFYHYVRREPCGVRGGSFQCLFANCAGGPAKYPLKLYRYGRWEVSYRFSQFCRHVREHVFVSPSSGRIIKPYLPAGASTQVVRNPIAFSRGEPAQIAADAPVGYIGRMTLEKDPISLAQAASTVRIPVCFIGDGPLLPAVRQSYPGATFTGWLAKEQVHAHLESMRALVMTSRWYEAAPLVIPEAHSAGIPVVAPTLCAGTEAIEHGRTGLFYEAGDPSSLRSTLEKLKDVELCRSMGQEAYDRFWSDPPTMESHLDAIEAVYESALRP